MLADSFVHPYETDPVDPRVHSPPPPIPPTFGVRRALEEANLERDPTYEESQLEHVQELLSTMHDVVLGPDGFQDGERSDPGVEDDDTDPMLESEEEGLCLQPVPLETILSTHVPKMKPYLICKRLIADASRISSR